SSSIIDLLTGKAIVVIHDFISLKKNKKNLAAIYVKVCIYLSSFMIKKVIFISESTQRVAKKLALFKNAETVLLPNPFFSFEKIANVTKKEDLGYLLLVSGLGANKDLHTAVDYYFSIPPEKRIPLKILGCGNGVDKVINIINGRDLNNQIEVIGFVSLNEVVTLYSNAKIVWAHSLAEGYGRTLAEAKLTCKNVLCTRISAFREQDDVNIYYYSYYSEFFKNYSYLIENPPHVVEKTLREHLLFETELRKIYE
ncbi:glycosyltransferase, partial [Salmonella enterica]|nr:glycosyltransferase family 4 protein [Salmonella enterica]EAS1076985.1 glycosyltransferase family 4 protein [Salmonella enterica]EAS1835357.1 glycosyltransferase [Salmonella enterica]EHO4561299.1 glycosyltransferase [Salmonella enterica subsp. enterica serovar Carrau]